MILASSVLHWGISFNKGTYPLLMTELFVYPGTKIFSLIDTLPRTDKRITKILLEFTKNYTWNLQWIILEFTREYEGQTLNNHPYEGYPYGMEEQPTRQVEWIPAASFLSTTARLVTLAEWPFRMWKQVNPATRLITDEPWGRRKERVGQTCQMVLRLSGRERKAGSLLKQYTRSLLLFGMVLKTRLQLWQYADMLYNYGPDFPANMSRLSMRLQS